MADRSAFLRLYYDRHELCGQKTAEAPEFAPEPTRRFLLEDEAKDQG